MEAKIHFFSFFTSQRNLRTTSSQLRPVLLSLSYHKAMDPQGTGHQHHGTDTDRQNDDQSLATLPCPILNLTPELVLEISRQLPEHSQIIFSQTCSQIRNILFKVRGSGRLLQRPQYLEYLAALARQMPGKWVCYRCNSLHDVNSLNTPKHTHRSHGQKPCSARAAVQHSHVQGSPPPHSALAQVYSKKIRQELPRVSRKVT